MVYLNLNRYICVIRLSYQLTVKLNYYLKKISKPENVKFLDEVTSIRKVAKDLKGIVNDAIYCILCVFCLENYRS